MQSINEANFLEPILQHFTRENISEAGAPLRGTRRHRDILAHSFAGKVVSDIGIA